MDKYKNKIHKKPLKRLIVLHKKKVVQLHNLNKMLLIKKEYGLLKHDNEIEIRIEAVRNKVNILYDLCEDKAAEQRCDYIYTHYFNIYPRIILK